MEMLNTILTKGRDPVEPEKLIRRDPVDPSTFRRMIRQMGLKVTQQRMAILESLSAGRAHVTAQEVFELVNAKHPEIGFATVYRFLRKMAEQNMVTEVRMGGLPARYELTPRRHHDHLTCVQCGQIVEFESQQIETLQEMVAKEHNFRLTHHVLELYGICPRCQTE
jgi:Fur family transcriptional regulator, ferric uptake regulator